MDDNYSLAGAGNTAKISTEYDVCNVWIIGTIIALMIDAVCTCETPVNLYHITGQNNPEDGHPRFSARFKAVCIGRIFSHKM